MQSDFVKVICQMGIFMICAQAIVHFRPKASYEKYLKMLVSIMLVMQMFVFVGGIFSVDMEQAFGEWAENIPLFEKEDAAFQIMGTAPEMTKDAQVAVEIPQITVQVAPVEKIHISVE